MRKYFKSISFTISILTLFLSISCLEEYVPPIISLDSPTDTLRTFVYAFNHCQEPDAIKILASTLTDDFTFYFDPKDVGNDIDNGHLTPIPWNKDEFLSACQNMFNNAYSIHLDIPTLETGLYGEYHGNDFYAYSVQISFLLYVDQSQGYQVLGPVDWKFRKCDDGKWRIYAICDHTAPELFSNVSASFGLILYMFE